MPDCTQSSANAAARIDTRSAVLQFYGLREQPFGVTPNPRFFYASVAHREALAALVCGVDNEVGFASLIAAPGLGKTTLLFDLLNQRHESTATAFIFNTQCTGKELVRQIGHELHIESQDDDPLRLQADLRQYLADRAHTRPVLIIIDEAQNLDDSALETVRLLSDFETPDRKLLHIVLAGQPELAEKLQRPGLAQVLQRIVIVSRLEPLRPAEVGEYVQHRLRVAGNAGRAIFAESAKRNIAALSRGIPREINRICFNAMLLGCASGQHVIGAEVIEEVASDLDLRKATAPTSPDASRRTPAGNNGEHQHVNRTSGQKPAEPAPRTNARPALPRPSAPRARPGMTASARPRTVASAFPAGPQVSNGMVRRRPQQPIARATSVPNFGATFASRSNAPWLGGLVLLVVLAGWAALEFSSSKGNPDSASAPAPSVSASQPQSDVDTASSNETTSRVAATRGAASTSAPKTARSSVKTRKSDSTEKTEPQDTSAPVPSNTGADGSRDQNADTPNVLEPRPARTDATPAEPPVPPPQIAERLLPANDAGIGPVVRDISGANHGAVLSAPPASHGAVEVPPVRIGGPIPTYPAAARAVGVSGDVVARVGINREGDVQSVHVVSGSPALVQAAVDSVRHWKYRPYYVNGRPEPTEIRVTVRFSLPGR